MRNLLSLSIIALALSLASPSLAQQNTLPRSVYSVTGTGAYVTVPTGNGAGDSEPLPVNCLTGCSAAGTQDTNWIQTLGAAVATGVGASGVNTPKVGIASDSTLTSVGTVTTLTTLSTVTNPVGIKGADGSGIASNANPVPVSDAGGSITIDGNVGVIPSAASTNGIAPVVSSAAEACHVLKSSAGNMYTLTLTVTTVTGYVLAFNATSAPTDGAVTPVWWQTVISNGTTGGLSAAWPANAPLYFSTGMTVCFSSTGPFTKTASATAAFSGGVQ